MTDSQNSGNDRPDRAHSQGDRRGGAQGRGGKPGFSRGGARGRGFGEKSSGYRGKSRNDGAGGFKDKDRKPRRDGDRKPYSGSGKRSWTPTGKDGEKRAGFGGDRKTYGKDGQRGGDHGDFGKKRFDSRGDKRDFDKPRGNGRNFDKDRKPRFDRDEREGQRPARGTEGGERRFDGGKPRRDFGGPRPEGRDHRRSGGRAERGTREHRNPVLSPARQAACAIGREVRERDAFVSEVIPGVLAQFEGISQEDSAFATKLARGVTATLGTLDEFIDRNLNSPSDIQEDVRDALRVSAYELLFLGKADYAAVDQGVELVCWVAPKAGGLANAVLRKMAKSAKAFPFGRPTLSLQVLARSQAFPLWLAKRLMNEMGLEKATAFMRACNADAPVHIALNAIKADEEHVLEVFDQAGSLLTPVDDVPGCYLVGNARVLAKPEVRELFEQGQVLVSDASAQAVAALACPDHDIEAFLEIGSGRGTKTILLQSDAVRSFGRTMPMVSVDDHGFKAEILAKRVKAYGIESVRPVKADGRKLSSLMPVESFDAVLLDAPCSGLGTLRRHPEIRWRLTEDQVSQMAGVELDMLIEAAKMVKPGGALTYATCTVFQEENEQVVQRFLKTKLGESFGIEKTLSPALTPKGPDAHFAVRLRRA